ncbi:MAG: reverse transcriptase/maturase family protein [Candidatus Paceibacterota bacterium]|jgi:retron-type reverse transcriptase
MSHIQFIHTYDTITSIENLLLAWKEFILGKKNRKDVQEFERNLMTNIILLHQDLVNKTYKHSQYEAFNISDPKPRNIHKAKVRDRLLHHAICRVLYLFFDRTFITDSYSCRVNKGTHKAINRFRKFAYQASKNHTKTVWVLKGDIKKFFANINHNILKSILKEHIQDKNILWLLFQIVDSFYTQNSIYAIAEIKKGLPLGNLTSQLLVNIYMNEFDQFMKHKIKAKYYIRYADDFVILSSDKKWLINILPQIKDFLENELKLSLHPTKLSISTVASGVDFLGWVLFPDHRVVRTITKQRMFRGIKKKQGNFETVQSYLGLLSHGNARGLEWKVRNDSGFSSEI